MKEIKAIIRPQVLQRVLEALHRLPHFNGASVSDCRGQGRGGGRAEPPAGEQVLDFADKTRLEIFCDDAHVEQLVETIRTHAHTGRPGDGVITVADLAVVMRIRTGERQDQAI
ncbi:MAG: P-II family nitrogen regulator [Phycisphaeraceae bacterium]